MGWPGNGDFVGFGWGRGARGVMLGVGKGLSTVCGSLKVVWRWGGGFRDEEWGVEPYVWRDGVESEVDLLDEALYA